MWQTYWRRYRRFWWVPLLILGAISGGFIWQRHQQQVNLAANQQLVQKPSTNTKHKPAVATAKRQSKPAKGGFIDLKGAVQHPGIYPIKVEQTRLFEVIKQAGDVTDQADTSQLNLAQKLVDQLIIYVPRKGEGLKADELIKATTTQQSTTKQQETPANETEQTGHDRQINLNQADSSQLQTLNGIGPKKAEQIIAYRTEQGKFKQVEDLQKVGGIGPKTFEQLKAQIYVE